MPQNCENPIADAILQHPEVKKYLQPQCDELRGIEAKGIHKTLDDLMRIREIRSGIENFIQELLANAVIIDADSPSAQVRTSAIARDEMVRLSDVRTDGESFATCDAGMFTSPWSRGFVHGADSALHVGDLAQKILRPSERIEGLKRVTWRKPTTTNLKLAVYARAFPGMDMSGYSFDGELVTSEGRSLTFFAMPDEQSPITTHLGEANPYARNILCGCNDCRKISGQTATYRLHELPSGFGTALDKDPSLRMSTALELLTLGIAYSHLEGETGARNVLKLMAGVNDLALPQSSAELCSGRLALRLYIEAARSGKSGMRLIPFEYRFPYMAKDGTGVLAVTPSVTCATNVMDGCRNGGPGQMHRGRR